METGSPEQHAKLLGAVRVASGIAFILIPRSLGRLLIGEDAESPGAQMFIRAFGARDVLLGAGALRASHRQATRDWLIRAGCADAFDAAAAAASYRRLPPWRGALAFTASTVPAALNLDTARRLGGRDRGSGGVDPPEIESQGEERVRRSGAPERWMYRGGRPNRPATALNGAWRIVGVTDLWPNRLNTLEVRARRSGRLTSFPVVVADYLGERYLVAMLGEGTNWALNVRAAGGRAVLRHGRLEPVQLEEVHPGARAPILRRYLQVAPGARPHIPVDRRAPLAEFERIAARYPVFRIVAVPTPPSDSGSSTEPP